MTTHEVGCYSASRLFQMRFFLLVCCMVGLCLGMVMTSCSDYLGGVDGSNQEGQPEGQQLTESFSEPVVESAAEYGSEQDGREIVSDAGSEAKSESIPESIEPKETNMDVVSEMQPETAPSWTVSLMTFNIRLGVANDGDNAWEKRKSMVFSVIRDQGGDFVGMQEAWKFQIEDILQAVPAYQCLGRGRQVDPDTDEWSPICYRHARWTPVPEEKGTFWLSETPETPGSKSWDSSLPRICTWARFVENATGRSLYVFNTHYDHLGQTARLNSSRLIASRMNQRKMQDVPVVFMGDFNAGENNEAILYLKGTTVQGTKNPIPFVDTFRVLYPQQSNVGTFHGWTGRKTGDKIDYIWSQPESSGGPKVTEAAIVYDNTQSRYPSDHFPVKTTLVFSR